MPEGKKKDCKNQWSWFLKFIYLLTLVLDGETKARESMTGQNCSEAFLASGLDLFAPAVQD